MASVRYGPMEAIDAGGDVHRSPADGAGKPRGGAASRSRFPRAPHQRSVHAEQDPRSVAAGPPEGHRSASAQAAFIRCAGDGGASTLAGGRPGVAGISAASGPSAIRPGDRRHRADARIPGRQ